MSSPPNGWLATSMASVGALPKASYFWFGRLIPRPAILTLDLERLSICRVSLLFTCQAVSIPNLDHRLKCLSRYLITCG